MPLIERHQPFEKAAEINIGDVVWTLKSEYNKAEDLWDEEFIGPLHVIDVRTKNIPTATLYVLFDSFDKTEIQARIHDIYVPIIEKIEPPRGYST